MLLLLLSLFVRDAHAEPRDEARRHFNDGLELIAAGNYDDGIAQFLVAYDLVPHPAVLYNIARAYADQGDYENAILYFDKYLETEPIDRSEVEGNVATLRARLEVAEAKTVEITSTGTTGGVATTEELAELQRHARELSELAERLAEREAAIAEGTLEPETVDPGPVDLGPSEGLEGALVEDLFDREVVTASNFGQDPVESPSAITVITAEDIRLSGASSLPEVLALAPGMDVMFLTAGQADVSIRGFNRRLSNKVLVLVDGRSVYLDIIGSVVWESLPVTLEEIDRIEIIRGPGSAIYGANAFGGVVNIITTAPGDPSAENVVAGTYGTNGTWKGVGVVNGREGNLGYRASASIGQKGRWAKEVDLGARPDISSGIENQDLALDVIGGNAQLDWRLGSKGYASLSGGMSDGHYEFYSLGALRNFYLEARQFHARGDVAWGPLHARVFYTGIEGDAGTWYYKTGAYDLDGALKSDVVDSTVDGYWQLGENQNHQLAAGVGYRYKTVEWDFLARDAYQQHHLNGYVQDQSDFGPVIVNAAARLDKHPLIAQPLPSFRLALIGKLGEGRSVRVNAGTAFRTPTFMESYSNIYIDTDTDGVYALSHGDDTLLPERIAAVELGVTDHHSDSWTAEVNLYGYQVDNLIDFDALDTSSRPTTGFQEDVGRYLAGETSFVNEDDIFRAVGGEVSAEYFGIEGIDVDASYAYERIVTTEGVEVLSTPAHKLNGQVKYRSPYKLDIAMNGSYVSGQTWDIRGFSPTGEIEFVPTPVEGRVVLSNVLVLHATPQLDISASAWNWLASVQGPQAQHPLGQPIGARYAGHVTYRF
jgi:iron complex outermembrane recepter protein